MTRIRPGDGVSSARTTSRIPTAALCLTVAGGSNIVNVTAVQFECDGNPARLWNLADDYNGGFYLKNVNSGLCLSPAGGAGGDNIAIVQYHCDGNPARTWRLVPNGYFSFIQNVSTGLCLSPAGGSTTLNATIVQYRCDSNPSRLWRTALA